MTPLEKMVTRSSGNGACIEFNGARHDFGYGIISVNRKNVYAHRLSYETFVGPIPPDFTIDHLCRNPPCWNPWHLDAVTRGENTLRGDTPSGRNLRKTMCPQGHPYSADNTYWYPNGSRRCMTCNRAYQARFRARYRDNPRDHSEFRTTHCKRGHLRTPESTVYAPHTYNCAICRDEAIARRKESA